MPHPAQRTSPTLRLLGYEFPRRPGTQNLGMPPRLRYARMAMALKAARALCSVTDRSLHLEISVLEARAMMLRDREKPVAGVGPLHLPWEKPDGGLFSSPSARSLGSG